MTRFKVNISTNKNRPDDGHPGGFETSNYGTKRSDYSFPVLAVPVGIMLGGTIWAAMLMFTFD
jgi:hypothetical protein